MLEEKITAEFLLHAYCAGAFPMGDPDTGEVSWYAPDPRAIQPIDDGFHVPKRLRRTVKSGKFRVTHNRAFRLVMEQCALSKPGREETWITKEILELYCEAYRMGFGYSVETWLPIGERDGFTANTELVDESGEWWLAGGVYGIGIGGAFFGESMFSNARDASKVALVKLVEHLRTRRFELFDVQFVNPHLEQFGVMEIGKDEYMKRLHEAVVKPVSWG